ncbi:MAG TPA: YfbM family protein [Gemmatimonadaceae bacterium]|nr:YfbM family protein [Gemmatimonadaceae bacterium]
MGMVCTLFRVTPAEVDEIIREPDAIHRILRLDEGLAVREVRPKGILGFLLRLTPITISEVDPDAPAVKDHVPNPDREIDIDKGWHGLHYLLTGTSGEGKEPACYMIKGGTDLDDEGVGRVLRPSQVQRFAAFLGALTREQVEQRYDPVRMLALEIYPEIWDRTSSAEEDPRAWLIGCFEDVRSFVQRAAAAGDGVVIYTS